MSCVDLALVLGEKVDRASATLPQTSTQALFTISGGRVVITSLFGIATTATGDCTGDIYFDPTVGVNFPLKTDGISNFAAGYKTSFVSPGTWANGGAAFGCPATIFSEGAIYFETTSSVFGQVSWTLTYVPLDEGASVAAA